MSVRTKGYLVLPSPRVLGMSVRTKGYLVLPHHPPLEPPPPEEPPPKPFMGASGVTITSPTGGQLHGMQMVKLDVRSKEAVEKVEINIDGKYWDKWEKGRKPPYATEWPTGIFKNGSHEIVAIVYYRGGRRMAADKKNFFVKNR